MMRVITAPAIEPVSLAEVKSQIGITTDNASDDLIRRRIKEARQFAENYMQRALITQTQEIRLYEFPRVKAGKIVLPFPNLLTIVHVKYIDQNGTLQTVTSTDYEIDTYSLEGSVRPIYGTVWPSPRYEEKSVRVQYTCGYGPEASDVPEALREALILIVGHYMNHQNVAESGITISRLPYAVRDILDNYAVVRYV